MVQHRRFMELALGEDGLSTPDGIMKLRWITRAEIIRNRSRDHGARDIGTSGAGVAGGALIGAVIAGPVGALGGGLLGSTIKRESSGSGVPRTVSATLIFESPDLAYSTVVSRDRVRDAEAFVAAVKNAMEHSTRS